MLSCTSCQFAILNFRCSVWTNRIRPALHVGGARAGHCEDRGCDWSGGGWLWFIFQQEAVAIGAPPRLPVSKRQPLS